jgi:organic hydroperoxide reductase OsmC/OhrA
MGENKEHHYKLKTVWQASNGKDTGVSNYDRTHTISIDNKPQLELTTDNALRGDKTKLNPEDLLVSAISSCHMLSYLYLCSVNNIIVTSYEDNATGTMIETPDGGGHFTEVTLNPVYCISEESMKEKSIELHHKAHDICYIANSVNFKVKNNPVCKVKDNNS